MYADDLVILSETKEGLQRCLDKLNIYTKKWDLKINLKKTNIVVFQNHLPTDFDLLSAGKSGKNIFRKYLREYLLSFFPPVPAVKVICRR